MSNEVATENAAATVAAPAPAEPAVNKQQLTVDKIVNAIKEQRKPDSFVAGHAPEFVQTQSGADLFLSADTWPMIQIGKNGGITVGLRSYPESNGKSALDAAIHGDTLLAAQNARDVKKAQAKAAPATSTSKAATSAKASFETGTEEAEVEESEEEGDELVEQAS
jgi:hypothetical protein